MSEGAACDLCGREGEKLSAHYGLGICPHCVAGKFHEDRISKLWGADLEVLSQEEFDPDLHSSPIVHKLEVSGTFPHHVDVAATFIPERAGHKMVKLFKDELQAGDPLFDDAIYIKDVDREGTRKLIANRDAQQAILDLVGNSGTLTLAPGSLRYHWSGRGGDVPRQQTLAVHALARHLSQLR